VTAAAQRGLCRQSAERPYRYPSQVPPSGNSPANNGERGDGLSVPARFRLFSGGEKIGSEQNRVQNCRAIIGGEMPRKKRPEPDLPPGPARDLVDLFAWLRGAKPMSVGQIATRAGYTPGHVSEVLRGFKAPSPDAAVRIAQALGADDRTVRRVRRRTEDLREWKRTRPRSRRPAGRPDDGQGWSRKGSPGIVRAELRIIISPGDDWRADLAGLGDFLKTL
jgi:transcriptional regulator with XRE-family HTH domain